MEESDEALLENWVRGDLRSFDKFYLRHVGKVSGYIRKKGVPKDEVSEVVQEVFLKMHLHISTYHPERRALPWFFTIVHNTSIDALRRGGKSKRNWNPVSLDCLNLALAVRDNQGDKSEFDAEVILNTLKADQKSLVDMRLLKEMSFAEMAASTGKSSVSLRKSYSRAIQALRDLLSKGNPS